MNHEKIKLYTKLFFIVYIIMIDTLDNDVYYAPAVEFEKINYH